MARRVEGSIRRADQRRYYTRVWYRKTYLSSKTDRHDDGFSGVTRGFSQVWWGEAGVAEHADLGRDTEDTTGAVTWQRSGRSDGWEVRALLPPPQLPGWTAYTSPLAEPATLTTEY